MKRAALAEVQYLPVNDILADASKFKMTVTFNTCLVFSFTAMLHDESDN
jgi:hypothetical protein